MAAIARKKTVIGTVRLRLYFKEMLSFLRVSNSIQAPRSGMSLALAICRPVVRSSSASK